MVPIWMAAPVQSRLGLIPGSHYGDLLHHETFKRARKDSHTWRTLCFSEGTHLHRYSVDKRLLMIVSNLIMMLFTVSLSIRPDCKRYAPGRIHSEFLVALSKDLATEYEARSADFERSQVTETISRIIFFSPPMIRRSLVTIHCESGLLVTSTVRAKGVMLFKKINSERFLCTIK